MQSPENSVPIKKTPFTGKKLTILQIMDIIKEKQPIKPEVLKANITISEPFLSSKRADEYIVNLMLAEKITVKKIEGADMICLSE